MIMFFVIYVIYILISFCTYSYGKIITLTDTNFNQTLLQHHDILVEFYAPWCNHCQTFESSWNEVAKRLDDSPMIIAKVDVEANKLVSAEYQIRMLPTIKYFRNHKFAEDVTIREVTDIVTWSNKKAGVHVIIVNSKDQLETFRKSLKVYVIGLFDSIESDVSRMFMDIAAENRKFPFALSSSPEVFEEYNVDSDTVVIIKDFEEGRTDLPWNTIDTSIETMATRIKGYTTPLVQDFNQKTAHHILSNPIELQLIYFSEEDSDYQESLTESMKIVATQYRGRLLSMKVFSSEKPIMDLFSIKNSSLPRIVISNSTNKVVRRYYYKGDVMDTKNVTQFIDSFFRGEVKRYYKSKKVLPEDTEGPLITIRGKSFAHLVLNNNKNVFIMLVARNCRDCSRYAPVWKELAEDVKDDDSLVIAQMNAEDNEVEGLEVQSVPKMIFYPGSNKNSFIEYDGKMDSSNLKKFIEEHKSLPTSSVGLYNEL